MGESGELLRPDNLGVSPPLLRVIPCLKSRSPERDCIL